MPTAATMLKAHQDAITIAKGAGQAGLATQAEHGPAVRALLAVINADNDPRRHVS